MESVILNKKVHISICIIMNGFRDRTSLRNGKVIESSFWFKHVCIVKIHFQFVLFYYFINRSFFMDDSIIYKSVNCYFYGTKIDKLEGKNKSAFK